MGYTYPVYKPSLKGNEKKYLNECIDTNWLTENGRFVHEFENMFSATTGAKYATATANGTVALHLALLTLGIGKGDEVIVPTLTYIATANAVYYTGATPVFVDSEPEFWQISTEDIKRKITKKTKAIIPVHLYGHPCDMDEIMKIAKEHNLFVIEDAAEAFGTKYKNQNAGTFGDIGVFSFYGNKTITTGEGGMLVCDNKTLIQNSIKIKGQGLSENRQYWHDIIGYNYRITNLCAAVGLAQLEKAQELINQKRAVAELYLKHLNGLPIVFQPESKDAFHTYWMFSILAEDEVKKVDLRNHLESNGIETRPLFAPIHLMPMYNSKNETFPNAENISSRGINLPSYPDLEEKDIIYICKTIKDFFK